MLCSDMKVSVRINHKWKREGAGVRVGKSSLAQVKFFLYILLLDILLFMMDIECGVNGKAKLCICLKLIYINIGYKKHFRALPFISSIRKEQRKMNERKVSLFFEYVVRVHRKRKYKYINSQWAHLNSFILRLAECDQKDRVLTAAAYFACEQIVTHCHVSRRMPNTEVALATIIIYDVCGVDKRITLQILMLWHLFLFHCHAGLVDVFCHF